MFQELNYQSRTPIDENLLKSYESKGLFRDAAMSMLHMRRVPLKSPKSKIKIMKLPEISPSIPLKPLILNRNKP